MAKHTEAELSLLATAMKSAPNRRSRHHLSLWKQFSLRQQLRRNMTPFLDKLRDHSLTSAGISIADFLAAQSRNTTLVTAALGTSPTPVKSDRDERKQRLVSYRSAEMPAIRKPTGGVLGPELTHVGPIVVGTRAGILASLTASSDSSPGHTTSVSVNPILEPFGNFAFADVAAAYDPDFWRVLSIDAYFLWTPEQDGFVAAEALIEAFGEALAWDAPGGLAEATGTFELYFEYANPAGLGVPLLYKSTTPYDLISTGDYYGLGIVRQQDITSIMRLRSDDDQQFFRMFANTPILVDVRAQLTAFIDCPDEIASIDYKDPSKDFYINFVSVTFDQYV